MGLDQYLKAEKYFTAYDGNDEEYKSIVAIAGGESLADEEFRSASISFTAGYWRKANQIHQWFVDNVQDGVDNCSKYYVSLEQLNELLGICNTVLADHSKAEELLPTADGFFFGNTNYDEWYFNDLEETVKILGRVTSNEEFDYYYVSSW
jgi:hypothetical protein